MTTQYEDQQLEMFGCLAKDIKGGAIVVNTDDPRELNNYAICILSDAQSVLANGDAEKARQFINKAKYLLSESSDILRKQESEANTSRPFAEPDCLKTEDGYIFYRLDDGSYVNDRNELTRDISYKSIVELGRHVSWEPIDEDKDESLGMK